MIDTGNDLKISELLEYVYTTNKFDYKKILSNEIVIIIFIKEDINEYCKLITQNKEIFEAINIDFDSNFIIKTLPFPFTEVLSEEIISNFENYLPLLSYSIIYHLKYHSQELKKTENLFEIQKILAFYYKLFILEEDMIEKEHFIKNIIFDEIKNSKFVLRNNIRIDKIMEKLVDTESLYSVFERC
jgi:hypothetical protein